MSTQVNRRRGTTAQHAAFTGAVGETTYDTDLKRLVAHDGALAGGFPAAHLHLAQTFAQTQTFAATENFFGSTATAANKISFLGPAGTGSSTLDFRTNTTPDLNFLRKYSDTPFQIELASSGGIDLVIDSNNNETGTSVRFLTNAIRGGAQTLLFTVQDTGGLVATGALDMGTHLINNVVNPVAAQDAATKAYVDGLISAGAPPFTDTIPLVKGSVTPSKLMRFEVDGFTAATTRVLTPPNADITLAGINIAQTFAEDQTFAKRILLPDTTSATVGGIYFGGSRALHNFGVNSLFGGVNSGNFTLTGTDNTGFGRNAGYALTSGAYNAFFGASAGRTTTTGSQNSFFGRTSGFSNLGGIRNSFFGFNAGYANTSGGYNSFFGRVAGMSNTTGSSNSFFGSSAGAASVTVSNNSFFGRNAGLLATGANNTLLGFAAGDNLTTGAGNLAVGFNIDIPVITGSNQMTIGNLIFGTGVDGTALGISSGNVGIAVITPHSGLQVGRSFAVPYRATAVTTTFLASDYTIDCTSGTFTVNLPTAVGITGRIYVVKNSGVGTITLDPAGAELIDSLATATAVSGAAIMTQSTGTGWIII